MSFVGCRNNYYDGDTTTKSYTLKAPIDVEALPKTSTSIEIRWNDQVIEDGSAVVIQEQDAQDEFQSILEISKDNTPLTISNLDPDTTYVYRLLTKKSSEVSLPSEEVSVTTASDDAYVPDQIQNFQAAFLPTSTIGKVQLSWDPPVGLTPTSLNKPDQFEIYRNGVIIQIIDAFQADQVTFVDAYLDSAATFTIGSTYSYKVIAKNQYGLAESSVESIVVTASQGSLQVPSGMTATPDANGSGGVGYYNQVELNWSMATDPDVQTFEIQYCKHATSATMWTNANSTSFCGTSSIVSVTQSASILKKRIITGLLPGFFYYFRIRSIGTVNNTTTVSSWHGVAVGKPHANTSTPMLTPTMPMLVWNPSIGNGKETVRFFWNENNLFSSVDQFEFDIEIKHKSSNSIAHMSSYNINKSNVTHTFNQTYFYDVDLSMYTATQYEFRARVRVDGYTQTVSSWSAYSSAISN
ncbi:MAG: fibronectin type III domain-containing protein [Bdellovibrionota bacterium]